MCMNKSEILKVLKQYGFDTKEYIVLSGAAMVLLGIKKYTKDIDISVTRSYYKYLLNNYNCTFEKINVYNNKVYFIDNIINFGIDFYDTQTVLVDDIRVQSPKSILQLKEFLNRKKDKKDIELIKKYKKNKRGI